MFSANVLFFSIHKIKSELRALLLLFGHTGLTLGLALLLEKSINRSRITQKLVANQTPAVTPSPVTVSTSVNSLKSQPVVIPPLKLDYRLVLIGSLLPDIIDKPLGLLILQTSLGNGRTIGHTLLFSLFLVSFGLLLLKKRNEHWLLIIACGSILHLILDYMWFYPNPLLWPLFGFGFLQSDASSWLYKTLSGFSHPSVYVPEISGFILCAIITGILFRRHLIGQFIKRGDLY